MSIVTIYGDAADDYIGSFATTYAPARAGNTFTVYNDGYLYDGQFASAAPEFDVYEFFISFDTSVLAGLSVDAAVLSLYGYDNGATQGYTSEIWVKDWGAAVTSADWVAGASLAAQTRVASFASAAMVLEAYNDFTNDSTFLAAINKTGTTRLMGASSRTNAGTTAVAGTNEYMGWYAANTAAKAPKLTVWVAEPGPTRTGGKPRDFNGRKVDLFGGRTSR